MTRTTLLLAAVAWASIVAVICNQPPEQPQGAASPPAPPYVPLYPSDALAGVTLPSMAGVTWDEYARLLWEATRGRWDPVVK